MNAIQLPKANKWVWGLAAAGLLVFILSRDPVRKTVSSAISDAERAVLRKFVGKGQESYIDACFALGEKNGISPYLLMGWLYMEGRFGSALTKGEAFGHTVYSGDFIPRIATADRDAHMAKNPLPDCKRVYWERPIIGNIPAYSGMMWVPAHDRRVARAGGNMAAAYAYNGGIPGGVGWGFTPWALDWMSFSKQLKDGAMWDEEKATATAIKLIKSNIAQLKKAKLKSGPLTGSTLVEAVIASYNTGAGAVLKALSAGRDLRTVTAHKTYIPTVLSIAEALGQRIEL